MGYDYLSPYPKDSLAALQDYLLNTKSYINKQVVDTTYHGNLFYVAYWAEVKWDSLKKKMTISCIFESMDSAAQADWIATREQLHLTEKTSGNTMLYLKVPVGQEESVISRLQNNPMVIYAEVNHVGTMQL